MNFSIDDWSSEVNDYEDPYDENAAERRFMDACETSEFYLTANKILSFITNDVITDVRYEDWYSPCEKLYLQSSMFENVINKQLEIWGPVLLNSTPEILAKIMKGA